MDIHICIPTLNRYDLLAHALFCLQAGTVRPTYVHIIDNGGRGLDALGLPPPRSGEPTYMVGLPDHNLGVAASWNHFIRMTSDIRIIMNDDIFFHSDTLGRLIQAFDPQAMLCPENIIGGNSFSCFILPDRIVQEVGVFDEEISPGWAYFEDSDYFRRITLAGFRMLPVAGCLVDHTTSSTLAGLTPEEAENHHIRFRLARNNYQAKWGGGPHEETFPTPYNR